MMYINTKYYKSDVQQNSTEPQALSVSLNKTLNPWLFIVIECQLNVEYVNGVCKLLDLLKNETDNVFICGKICVVRKEKKLIFFN